jgi:hypothetical protein
MIDLATWLNNIPVLVAIAAVIYALAWWVLASMD